MTEPARPRIGRQRAALLAAFVAILLTGVGLGVFLERLWLRPSAEKKGDPRLLGKWINEEDGTAVEYRPDGTLEGVFVTTWSMSLGGRPDPNPRREEKKVTGQWRWANRETIEINIPDAAPFVAPWTPARISIDGDRLTAVREDGKVTRFTRGK